MQLSEVADRVPVIDAKGLESLSTIVDERQSLNAVCFPELQVLYNKFQSSLISIESDSFSIIQLIIVNKVNKKEHNKNAWAALLI
jgi:hypothetical protein